MSRRYKFHNQDRLYFVTYTVVNWIDLFTRDAYRDIILKSLEYCCRHKGLEIYGWVIMTNHVHLIIGTHGNNMEDILRDHKRHTAQELLAAIKSNTQESIKEWMLEQFLRVGQCNSNNTTYQLWQQHNKPIELYSEEVIIKYLDYIHNNPVRAGFVNLPEDWLYSSAREYEGKAGKFNLLTHVDIAIRG